jgi:hypothetical protein
MKIMLRSLFRLFSSAPVKPSLIETDANRIVLYARIDTPAKAAKPGAAKPGAALAAKSRPRRMPAQVGHRERLLSMRLEHTKICGPRRCQRLRRLGIVTAGDLSNANPERLAIHFAAPRKALRVIRQYRRAIRFAAAVPGMMPRDALLLISIHRRSVRGLASESAPVLHRDLERFAESTQGRLQLRGRQIPSTRRLKRWIAQCASTAIRTPLQARAA